MRPWLRAALLGQILSMLLTGTGICSTYLAQQNVSIPTAQSFLHYVLLTLVYLPLLCSQRCPPRVSSLAITEETSGDEERLNPEDEVSDGTTNERKHRRFVENDLWKYALVALVDVEANYLVVKAYQYTTITSVQLIDCFTIPSVIFLSFVFLRARYQWRHIVALLLCLGGLVALILSDVERSGDSNGDAKNALLGDILCLIGSFLYAVSNVAQEAIVKRYDRIEFLALLGVFGSLINGSQFVILERSELKQVVWNEITSFVLPVFFYFFFTLMGERWIGRYRISIRRGEDRFFFVFVFFNMMTSLTVLSLIGFAACLFLLYSGTPFLLQWSSATLMNLSFLTSDVYAVLVGTFLFSYSPNALFGIAFAIIVTGVLLYNYQEYLNQKMGNNEQINVKDPRSSSIGLEMSVQEESTQLLSS